MNEIIAATISGIAIITIFFIGVRSDPAVLNDSFFRRVYGAIGGTGLLFAIMPLLYASVTQFGTLAIYVISSITVVTITTTLFVPIGLHRRNHPMLKDRKVQNMMQNVVVFFAPFEESVRMLGALTGVIGALILFVSQIPFLYHPSIVSGAVISIMIGGSIHLLSYAYPHVYQTYVLS